MLKRKLVRDSKHAVTITKRKKIDLLSTLPDELLHKIIPDEHALQKLLGVSKSLRNRLYNDKYLTRFIIPTRKIVFLKKMFKNGYTNVIDLVLHFSKGRIVMREEYMKLSLLNGRLGTSQKFIDNYLKIYTKNNDSYTNHFSKYIMESMMKKSTTSLYVFYTLNQRLSFHNVLSYSSLHYSQYNVCSFLKSSVFEKLQVKYDMPKNNWEIYMTCYLHDKELTQFYIRNGYTMDLYCYFFAALRDNGAMHFIQYIDSELDAIDTVLLELFETCISLKLHNTLFKLITYCNLNSNLESYVEQIKNFCLFHNSGTSLKVLMAVYYISLSEHFYMLKDAILCKSSNVVNYIIESFPSIKCNIMLPWSIHYLNGMSSDKDFNVLCNVITCGLQLNQEQREYIYFQSISRVKLCKSLSKSRYKKEYFKYIQSNTQAFDDIFTLLLE